MPKLRPPSTPRPSKLIKLAIQATHHSSISGRKKEGSDAPKPTLPKLKCLEGTRMSTNWI